MVSYFDPNASWLYQSKYDSSPKCNCEWRSTVAVSPFGRILDNVVTAVCNSKTLRFPLTFLGWILMYLMLLLFPMRLPRCLSGIMHNPLPPFLFCEAGLISQITKADDGRDVHEKRTRRSLAACFVDALRFRFRFLCLWNLSLLVDSIARGCWNYWW